jgi:hypothetical protein
MILAQQRVIKDSSKAPTPSQAAVLNAFRNEQETRPIWNGRPSGNRGIPIELYHRSFGRFLRAVTDESVEIELTAEDYSAVHSLFAKSAQLYGNEAGRTQAVRVCLDKVIRRQAGRIEVEGMRADGGCLVLCGNEYALGHLEEHKNDVGTGGCDPSHQGAFDIRVYNSRSEVRGFLVILKLDVTLMICR